MTAGSCHRSRGEEGLEAPSLQENFGQQQPTYHPRPPVAARGRRAGKVQLLGFCFSCGGRASPSPGSGSVRDTPAATGRCRCHCHCPKENLLLCGSALKEPGERQGHLGEVGAWLGLRPGGWEGFAPRWGRRKESLGQVFHRQLLLQVPVVGDRHILVGGGHQ